MAKIHGKGGAIRVAGSDAVGLVQNWSLDTQVKYDESYSMGDDWTDNEASYKSSSGSFEVYLDESDAGQIQLEPGVEIQLDLYPDGNTTGKKYRSGTVLVTAVQENGQKDGYVSKTVNWNNKSGGIATSTVA